MKKFIFTIIALSAFAVTKAQLLDSLALDSAPAYSINRALHAKDPSKIYKIVMTHQHLDTLPRAIVKLKNLQYMDLGKNKFKAFPEQICELRNLQYLNLEDNKKLDSLPYNIGNLTHLKWLILNRTNITAFPVSAGKLTSLEYIDLWGTPTSVFPMSMKNLKNLKIIDLRVILFSDQKKKEISSVFPSTTQIKFSKGCGCGF